MLFSLETRWPWYCVTMFLDSLRLAESHGWALFAILVGKCNGVRWPFASTMASTVAAQIRQDGVEWRWVGTGGGRYDTKRTVVSDHQGDCISKTWFSCQYGYRIIHSNCVHTDWKRFWNKCGMDVFWEVKYKPFFHFICFLMHHKATKWDSQAILLLQCECRTAYTGKNYVF